jgi:hypothetical protein
VGARVIRSGSSAVRVGGGSTALEIGLSGCPRTMQFQTKLSMASSLVSSSGIATRSA